MNSWRPALEAALLLALLLAVVLLAARHWMVWPAERDEEDEDMRDLPQETDPAPMGQGLGIPLDDPWLSAEASSSDLLGNEPGNGPGEPSGALSAFADEPTEQDVTEWLHGLHDPIETAYARNHEFLMAARADADYVQAWIKGHGPLNPGRVPIHPGWHETELAAAGLIPNRTLGDQVAA